MNCRPGDIAVVVKPCRQQGRITRCIRLATAVDIEQHGMREAQGRPVWLVEDQFEYTTGFWAPLLLDAHIRPIRDQPGEDETLTWAGKPADIKPPEAA